MASKASNGALEAVRLAARRGRRNPAADNPGPLHFIGAEPNSNWLAGALKLDARGFVVTGRDAAPTRQLLETSRDGVFVIGDVRAGSIERVAEPVGEVRKSSPCCTPI